MPGGPERAGGGWLPGMTRSPGIRRTERSVQSSAQGCFNKIGQCLPGASGQLGQSVVISCLVAGPRHVEATDRPQGNVLVGFRTGPIAGAAHCRLFLLRPIDAMLAGPRFCPIAGPANQLKLVWGPLATTLPADLIRHLVVNLQISPFVFRQADAALAPRPFDQRFLETLREYLATRQSARSDLPRVGKAIRPNTLAVTVLDTEGLKRDPLFSHVTGGAWRVVISVAVLEFLRSDVAMFEDMIDDRLGSLRRDGLYPLKEPFREIGWHAW